MKATLKGTWKSLSRMLSYTKGNRIQFFLGLILNSADFLLFQMVFGYMLVIIFSAVETHDDTAIGKILLLLSFGSVLFLISSVLGGWMQRRASTISVARMRREVMDHALSLPAVWFDERHSGDVLSRLTADIQAAEQTLSWQLLFPIKALFAGVGGAVLMFTLDWRMALLAIAMGGVSVWATTRFATPIKNISEKIQAGIGKVSEGASDLLAAAPILRLFNLGDWATGRMNNATQDVYRYAMKRTKIQTAQDIVNTVSGQCLFIGLILIGSIGVIYGLLDFPKLMGLVQFNNGLSFMFNSIGGAFTQLQASLAGANRVFEMLDAEEEAADAAVLLPKEGRPAIEIKNLCFAYEEGQTVLASLNETVYAGEKVALVGGSGSGKSTALKLLLGFYGAQSGDIELFGHSVAAHSTALRKSIAYVSQTCYLFFGTVKDNIAAGRADATDGEIEQAAKAALAHDFIMELPQCYDTEVGERGAQLSGGQRQRIAIARAILKNAPILLLDEATASLDSQSEALVQQALDGLMEGRTVVVVAHRLSTIRHADRILVLDGGRIVERGSHDELLARDSLYAAYCKAQFEGINVA